jgi:peptidyl-Asp metalloendopeptidase
MTPNFFIPRFIFAIAAFGMLYVGENTFAADRNLFVEAPATVAAADKSTQSKLDRIKKRKTVKDVRVVQIDTKLLTDTKESLNLNVPVGTEFPVVLRRIERRSEKDYSWIGMVTGKMPGTATFVVRDGQVSGTIRPGNEIYMVEPLGAGLHAIIKIDPTKFPPEHPPTHQHGSQSGTDTGSSAADLPTSEQPASPPLSPVTATPTQIDVIVAYTAAAKAQHDDMSGLIQTAVDEANTSYADSGVNLRLRLVHNYQTSYTESTSFSTDLSRFRTPNDQYMDEIHTRRNQHNADVAILIVDNDGACGLATTINATTASQAFAVVYWDCATGYFSFAHEIGHLQACRHNPEADSSTTPYGYGHGYLNTDGGWRTIMAYNDANNCPGGNCTRVQCWSTPLRIYHCAQNPANGTAMGTAATHDCARVLNNTRTRIAAFRPISTTPSRPGRKCLAGQKCCEPAPDGGCWLCYPTNKLCP